jgi:hypothetical protein
MLVSPLVPCLHPLFEDVKLFLIGHSVLLPFPSIYVHLTNVFDPHEKDFEAELDDDHEIGARLVSFGQNVTFHIEDIGYHGPDMITFYGRTESMEKVQLIQNISQLSVLLIAVNKQQSKP